MHRRVIATIAAAVILASCSSGSDASRTVDTLATVDTSSDTTVPTEPEATEPADTTIADPPEGETAEVTPGSWTVLLYSMADTDLEPFMVEDVNELGEVGSTDMLNVVALVDRAADYGDDPLLDQGAWTGAKTLYVQNGAAEVLTDHGDLNTGDPQVLTDFIAEGVLTFPAEHYVLVISDHGASWPGVGADESADQDSLDLAEINQALSDGLAAADIDRFDMIGFDACLMATYEVITSLAPLADRMVASEELEPGHGWDYNSFSVIAEGGSDVDSLGEAILDGFRGQAVDQETDAEITLSLLDLTQVPALEDAVAEFSAAISERAATIASVVGSTRQNTIGYGQSPEPTEDTHMADLGHLVSQIGVQSLDLSDPADAVIRAIGDVVLRTVEGAAKLDSTGISIYFPPTEDLFNPDYEAAVGDSPWLGMLRTYYGAGEALPTEERAAIEVAEGSERGAFGLPAATTTFNDDGLSVVAELTEESAANVVETALSYGVVGDDGSVIFLGEEPAELGAGGALGATFDLTTMQISDGTNTATAYLTLEADDDGLYTIDVPMAYYDADDQDGETYEDALLSITFDPATGDIVSETFYSYDDETGMYGELSADPLGTIVPEVLVYAADGSASWQALEGVELTAELELLTYDFVPLDPGTRLYVELLARDFGGNIARAGAQVTTP
jgi:hypothetical protein